MSSTGSYEFRSASRKKRAEVTVWQRRFWEHTLQDENDLKGHFDNIHYNPVKHKLAQQVKDWQWSSFHRFVRMGWYDAEWGGGNEGYNPIASGE